MTYQHRPADFLEPIDLDRVVWDPEYRAEVRVALANAESLQFELEQVSASIQSR
ncbi:MAG: hypothetical protein HKM95_04265 [Inquilinus sp.]|nr:hypothetical protein [Inquilinus sp.]